MNPGTGGGCVTSGPFTYNNGTGYVLNIGPGASQDYNPRCLVRDLHTADWGPLTKPSAVSILYETCGGSLPCFYGLMDSPFTGIHSVGHYQLGGAAGDVFVSPGDPAFWLHHANLDRVWAVWQYLGTGEERVREVFGTETNFNSKFSWCSLTGLLSYRFLQISCVSQSLPARTSHWTSHWTLVVLFLPPG